MTNVTKPGLKLSLKFIDSRLRLVQDFRLTDKQYETMDFLECQAAEYRLDGAASVLKDLRERIVRAIGPDDE